MGAGGARRALQAAAAKVVVLLVQNAPVGSLAPMAPALLQALSGAVKDPSPSVRKLMSAATALVAALCPVAVVDKLIVHQRTSYMAADADGAYRRVACMAVGSR